MRCEIEQESATWSWEALIDCPHHCAPQAACSSACCMRPGCKPRLALHLHASAPLLSPPVAGAAPPAASPADSGADDAAGSLPAAAVGPGGVLSRAGHGPAETAAQAGAAAADCVSLGRRVCPPPGLLLVAGCRPSVALCSAGWLKPVHFCPASRGMALHPKFPAGHRLHGWSPACLGALHTPAEQAALVWLGPNTADSNASSG